MRICRHGLYTLMASVHHSADPARSAAARAILSNIHHHPGNATTLYKCATPSAVCLQRVGCPSCARLCHTSMRAGGPPLLTL
jgi:hypothetical protein